MDVFNSELEFERCLIDKLTKDCGWKGRILDHPTEKDILDNWAQILFQNNRGIDRLNDHPLTEGEMAQIIDQIKKLKTPLRLNGFINGRTVSIIRDNPDDIEHFGKEISLKIYDRKEIAGGDSLYQIAEQPIFATQSGMISDRRGDVMLLINGMPVIHIELKRSGVPVIQACNQIAKYASEGVFTGVYSLVQIFVAMNPSETLYFANPGPEGKFNPDFYFHWADFYNEPINDWKKIATTLLSIPMAHQLIGFYTVADNTDGILKVMRSYQFYAASAIADKVVKVNRDGYSQQNNRGGFVWHTTGSGKTMTSFKSAHLIAESKDADKVIFLVDRIELGTQSLEEYRGFAEEGLSVQQTENTDVLIFKLKSNDPADILIVTSIQKMSRIREDGMKEKDLQLIAKKRVVFIVDECHRDTFGEMMQTIKATFPCGLFFGFTGTPILKENTKKQSFTSDVFGDELHRYSIADGIRDKNVLGFDPYMVQTFREKDLRKLVALEKAKANSEREAIADPVKSKAFYHYMNDVPMTSGKNADGKTVIGIESFVPTSQYRTDEHRNAVVDDILENWEIVSHGRLFHAIFATSSIPEAMEYYHIFKSRKTDLNITCLFDPSIDNDEGDIAKERNLAEIIEDYRDMFDLSFSIPTFANMKKDMSNRLSHKEPYQRISGNRDAEIDLLIVVDQMLTGFDSKWVNALYLDKELRYEGLIQAFSRTNRLFDPEKKPFGIIKYYRRPFTMKKNIEDAVKLYAENRPLELFVPKLAMNLNDILHLYKEIEDVFTAEGIDDFSHLPESMEARSKFAKLFRDFNARLEAAKVQGFSWKKDIYHKEELEDSEEDIEIPFGEEDYLIFVQRYKELYRESNSDGFDVPYELQSYITEINTDKIDADYMNSRFARYQKALNVDHASAADLEAALNELHKTFAILSVEDQKYADLFLHDVQRGNVIPEEGKTFLDYVYEYKQGEKSKRISEFSYHFGFDEDMLREMIEIGVSDNAYGRFDKLFGTIDIKKAKEYLEAQEGHPMKMKDVNNEARKRLRSFLVAGGEEQDNRQ